MSTPTLKSTHLTFTVLVYQVPQKKKVNERMYSVCVSYYYDLEIYFKGAEKWLSDEQHLLCDSEDEF